MADNGAGHPGALSSLEAPGSELLFHCRCLSALPLLSRGLLDGKAIAASIFHLNGETMEINNPSQEKSVRQRSRYGRRRCQTSSRIKGDANVEAQAALPGQDL